MLLVVAVSSGENVFIHFNHRVEVDVKKVLGFEHLSVSVFPETSEPIGAINGHVTFESESLLSVAVHHTFAKVEIRSCRAIVAEQMLRLDNAQELGYNI